jgi:cell division protein ZapE
MPHTPLSRYYQLVERCEISHDPAQLEVIEAFEKRYNSLCNPTPASFFEKIFGRLEERQMMRGLYLWGGVGRGKSMLMDIFYNSINIPNKKRVHFHEFMLQIHAAIHQKRATKVEDALLHVVADLCNEFKLLCFDELQVKDIGDAMILSRLFFEIIDRNVMVIFTSNRPPKDLYLNGLQREKFLPFIELIEQNLDIMEIKVSKDYRQGRELAIKQRYIAPHNSENRRSLYQQFVQLINHQMPHPLELVINHRILKVPLTSGNAAWFNFKDLCDTPLAPADYLELTQIYRYFFIEDIPHLSSENRNQAIRFINLIDILYEARAMLFATAASSPEYLHVGGDNSFEFARTASRLREMMSEDYYSSQA